MGKQQQQQHNEINASQTILEWESSAQNTNIAKNEKVRKWPENENRIFPNFFCCCYCLFRSFSSSFFPPKFGVQIDQTLSSHGTTIFCTISVKKNAEYFWRSSNHMQSDDLFKMKWMNEERNQMRAKSILSNILFMLLHINASKPIHMHNSNKT